MTNPETPISSTQLKVPVNDLTIEGVKVENALLHRRLLMLHTLELKLRAALELATGVPWDSENLTDLSGDQLEELVARNMAHGLNLPMSEALKRIEEHKRLANPSQIETSTPQDIKSEVSSKSKVTIDGKPAVSPSATA